MKMWVDTPTLKSHPLVTIGVDMASGKDWSVYRCTCGYTTTEARPMLIHLYEMHGGPKWT